MTFKIEVDYKKINFNPIDDIFDSFDTGINFIFNGKSFFEYFSPIKRDSELARFIVHSEWESSAFTYHHNNAKFPLFSMVMEINFGLKQIQLYDILVMTHDAYQTEFVFYRDEEGIHIFFHLKYQGLWYDGNQIIFTRQIPEKSRFVVNTNEFIYALDDIINQLQVYLSTNYLDIYKDPLVQRSFGYDKSFNNFFAKNKGKIMISE